MRSRLMVVAIAALDLDAVSAGRASLRGPGASEPTLKLHPDGLLSPLRSLLWIPTGFEILAPLAVSVRVGVPVTGDAQFDDVRRQTLEDVLPEMVESDISVVTRGDDSAIQALEVDSVHLGDPRGADDVVHLGAPLRAADPTPPGDLDSEPLDHRFEGNKSSVLSHPDWPHYVHLYGKVFSRIQQVARSPSVSRSRIMGVEVVA